MTQLLRILTGAHAGAHLILEPGAYSIGTEDEVDIRLTDWPGEQGLLRVDVEEGEVRVRLERQEAGSAQPMVCPLLPLVPVDIGEVVMCVGSQAMDWPSDVALLAKLFRPTVRLGTQTRTRHPSLYKMSTFAIIGVCAAVGVAMAMPTVPRIGHTFKTSLSAVSPSQDVRARLARIHVSGLQVRSEGGAVLVNGMVLDEAQDQAVRAVLSDMPMVVCRYGVAQVQARGIEEALGFAGAHVIYSGDGVFVVQGQVRDLVALTQAVQRVRHDMDANVRAVENTATQIPSEVSMPAFTEAVASRRVQYMQTPDGVKHIYVTHESASQ